jgi:hypothetical protein|tara:strand:+ start:62 stop:427 length:366 start_codon:yes stop_codon:yes gene_type:complete
MFGFLTKVLKPLVSIGQKAIPAIKSGMGALGTKIASGFRNVKQFFMGKPKPTAPVDPKLSTTLRQTGKLKVPPVRQGTGTAKIPYEPPIKVGKFRPVVDKGRALNDPVMIRQPSGYYGESI